MHMRRQFAILREHDLRSASCMRWMWWLYGVQVLWTLVLVLDVWYRVLPILIPAAMVAVAFVAVTAVGLYHRRVVRDWDRFMDGMS